MERRDYAAFFSSKNCSSSVDPFRAAVDALASMVVVTAMNIGLMMPPIGIGFYIACRIGDASRLIDPAAGATPCG